ncbi:MAG: hypothetical protein QW331_04445 [Candidatus Woesearchaeota archaeon]
MDSVANLERAKNELRSHSYYSIFYVAKALLLTEGVKTEVPEEHKKTYEAFKKIFVDSERLDLELFRIYQKMMIRAEELLGIFEIEKGKRAKFTYKTIPQANKEPAEESLMNAAKFLQNCNTYLEKSKQGVNKNG